MESFLACGPLSRRCAARPRTANASSALGPVWTDTAAAGSSPPCPAASEPASKGPSHPTIAAARPSGRFGGSADGATVRASASASIKGRGSGCCQSRLERPRKVRASGDLRGKSARFFLVVISSRSWFLDLLDRIGYALHDTFKPGVHIER